MDAIETAELPTPPGLVELTHFVRLARRGKHRGCSSGERQARNLAKAILEAAPVLDDSAINGAVKFLVGCAQAPWKARELLEN
jgi:hypothetical protein